jgi:hypothetical protein
MINKLIELRMDAEKNAERAAVEKFTNLRSEEFNVPTTSGSSDSGCAAAEVVVFSNVPAGTILPLYREGASSTNNA